jgi:hypothetical protein
VSHHALFKKSNNVLVVRILFKFQGSAIFHELLEFGGMTFAKFFQSCLCLLLFDVIVLLVLASARETLPRKTAS